jgi:hypothetical protein
LAALLLAAAPAAFAADDVVSAVHGTVTKVDSAAKTIVVKGADGTEHVFHVAKKTAIHGTEEGAKDTYHGLKEGSEVVAHYTVKGGQKTATEVDKVGAGGLKVVEGTASTVGKDGKKIVVKAADGTETAFESTKKVATKTGKVTVYYTEEGGKKVAHFFEKL